MRWRRRSDPVPRWEIPTFAFPVQDEARVEVVENAFLSPLSQGPLRTFEQPTRYIRGAVYDGAGDLVIASQKVGGLGRHPWVPADPARVDVDPRAPLLQGRWLYGGHWIQHFGHFLIETLTTLWPEEPDVEGLVFHQYLRTAREEPWMLRFLELAGRGGLPITIVRRRRGRRVEELVVPSRTVVANGWGHPQAREVWDRMALPFRDEGTSRRVYLSRTSFSEKVRRETPKKARSTLERDQGLDRLFAGAGFDVVEPQHLSIDDQIRLMTGAEVVAGNSGSALHLTAFAPRGARVLEIGDERNPHHAIGLQRVIDRLSEHPHVFVGRNPSVQQVAELLPRLDL